MKILAFILLQFSAIQQTVLSELRAFQNEDGIKHGIVAASIHRVSDNKTALDFNETKAVNSASTLKLITTATALSKLGADFRYTTDLLYSGTIQNGVLDGDLIIEGSGDPSLGSERGINPYQSVLNGISSALISLGVSEITGNVIINDETIFDYDMPDSWTWEDMGNYYGAIPHKFNINENFYTVFFEPGHSLGDDAAVSSLMPFDADWKIINLVKTGETDSGDQVYIYGSPTSDVLLLRGTVPLGKTHFPVKGSIPNPAKLFRKHLLTDLESKGITVQNKTLEPLPEDFPSSLADFHLIKRFHSQTLAELSKDCNYSSINMYADAFLHTHSVGDEGFLNFEDGVESMKAYWEAKGLTLGGFMPKDGSGLSPSGVITTKNMTDILSTMRQSPAYDAFFKSIAVVGKDGTVSLKDRNNITGGRVSAKSGSIESTRAYAGYFTDKTGEQFSFMISVNRYEEDASKRVRAFLDDFLVLIGSR